MRNWNMKWNRNTNQITGSSLSASHPTLICSRDLVYLYHWEIEQYFRLNHMKDKILISFCFRMIGSCAGASPGPSSVTRCSPGPSARAPSSSWGRATSLSSAPCTACLTSPYRRKSLIRSQTNSFSGWAQKPQCNITSKKVWKVLYLCSGLKVFNILRICSSMSSCQISM